MYSNWLSVAGSMTVRSDTVNDDDEVGINSNSSVRNGKAISVKLGHRLDNALAKIFYVPGTNTMVKWSSCKVLNHLTMTHESGFLGAVSLDTKEPHHWCEVLAGEWDRPEAFIDFKISALSVNGLFPLWVLHCGPEVFRDV